MMRHAPYGPLFVLVLSATSLSAQSFDVVSIKRSDGSGTFFGFRPRPDGFAGFNLTVNSLISRAYPGTAEVIGPEWARTERYDVTATAGRPITPAEDRTMVRSLLADRFKLAVHLEQREADAWDLVWARSDRRLGAGLQPLEKDCRPIQAERAALVTAGGTPPRPGPTEPPPPCQIRMVNNKVEGEGLIADLLLLLRLSSGRPVVDKTGLTGTYRVTMEFDAAASRRPPGAAPAEPSGLPLIFTAVQEQLGLKFEPSKTLREVVIVDRVERPTEN